MAVDVERVRMESIMADLKRGRAWDAIAREYGFESESKARRAVREWQVKEGRGADGKG